MQMFRTEGIFMLPEHFSIEPANPSIWKKMPATPKMAKYSEASRAISGEPPNQKGRNGAMLMLMVVIVKAQIRQQMSDWRSTRRAASKSLAPMKWATCTEKPSEAA